MPRRYAATRHGTALVRGALVLGVLAVAALAAARSPASTSADPSDAAVPDRCGRGTAFGATWLAAVARAAGAALVVRWCWSARCPRAPRRRRLPRDELRLETGSHPARPTPGRDFAALVRIDRASVWRSVPLRRGLVVLACSPGLVALAGDLDWDTLTILPGLVASGGALLFGVNAWCLDGRGALWRESLPVAAGLAFPSGPSCCSRCCWPRRAVTLLLAALRAGVPTAAPSSSRWSASGRGRALQVVVRVDALVGAQAVRRGPAQRPGHPGAARA